MKNIKKLLSLLLLLSFVINLIPDKVSAQTSPLSLPLFNGSTITYKGSWTFPDQDGAGGWLSHGGEAFGVSEDGKYVYVACQRGLPQKGIAKLEIPGLGGVAKVVAPCQGPNDAAIEKILPGPWDAGQKMLGGVLEQGGRIVVSAYGSYDANDTAIASHWSGSSLTSLSGPFKGAVSTGLVKSYMGPIPTEWRSLLGGPAFAMSGYTSIISRQSTGATFTVFDPATITSNGFPMKMLLGCPFKESTSCQTWTNWGPSNNNFQGAEMAGGGFIIPGTRTFAAIEREASGMIPVGGTVPYEGYGYPTSDINLHGKPYPSPEGVIYIYSLSDPVYKGNKGYPYRLVAKLYDLADLVAVNQGTKDYKTIKQYATVDMPASTPSESIEAGAYNPVTGDYYLIRSFAPNSSGRMTVHVYGGFGSGGTGPVPDTVAPTVSITSPSSASTVSGSSVSVSANATDNVGVVGVQFKVNGVNLGVEDTSAPYGATWNTTTYTNGSHTITAVARDAAGNTTTSSSVSVNVSNTTVVPPTADIKVNGGDASIKINPGTSVSLTWTSTNATSCTVTPGSFTGTSGTQSVTPATSTVYQLSCTGSGGTTSDSVTVSVNTPTVQLPTADIKANGSDGPISVPATSGVTLTWTSTNATSCSVTPGGYSGLNGTQVTPAIESGRTYTISCTGAGGTKTDSVVVNPSNSTTDTTKPTVNITAPTTFTTVAGIPVFVSANATDNVGVVGVQFKLDGVNLGAEDTSAPYSTIWDTTNATAEAHVLTAVARDAAGNTTTSFGVTVTVTKTDPVDTIKPTTSITSPLNSEEVSGSVSISASASDDVGVVGVQFKLNGANLNSEDNTAPYETTWNTETVSNGSYTLTVVARDAAGNTTTSSSVNVSVNNVSEDVLVVPPEVELVSPNSGANLSGIVTVSASAEDDKGIAGVQFKIDGVNLLPEDTTAPYTISWDTKTSPNGSRSLTATARDVEGNQVTSLARVVSVSNETSTSNLKIGDRIRTTAWINVRSTAGGRYVGSQRTGRTGTITAGPGYANGLTWWKVNFTSGADGWVAEKFITKATVAMTDDDYRKNIANIYLLIKYLQDRIAGQTN